MDGLEPEVIHDRREIVSRRTEAPPRQPGQGAKPGRSVVMTRRCRCVHGARSARNEYRHPGIPGTRTKGSPASSPNSDQATIRPSGRSRLRSRTPARTASVTIGNPDNAQA